MAPKTPILSMLPTDILLEIVARFDFRTFIRCAATCKLLRRDLLSPRFIRCFSQAAPCILTNFCADAKRPLTIIHPTVPAAASFCHNHLSRFLSRKGAGNLLCEYRPISSRHGLVVLQRLNIKKRSKSGHAFDLCVYDLMSGTQTFFCNPPEIWTDRSSHHKYVLLTKADGINNSFLLLVFDLKCWNINFHTASSCGTRWSVTYGRGHDFPWWSLKECDEPAIIRGGVIHWIACLDKQILSYNFATGKTSSVKLPSINSDVKYKASNLYFATPLDKKLLKLLAIQGFMLFVWLQLPVSSLGGSDWSLVTVIDMEEKLRTLDPSITGVPVERTEFEGSGNSTGDVVFLEVVYKREHGDKLLIFDISGD